MLPQVQDMELSTPPQLVLSLAVRAPAVSSLRSRVPERVSSSERRQSKADFVRTSVAAEKLPSPPQIAAFLRALVSEVEGMLSKRRPSPDLLPELHAGLLELGWDVASKYELRFEPSDLCVRIG